MIRRRVEMEHKNYDVILIGGGIMGSSTAYHLMKADPTLKVVVIEKDLAYEKSSTTLSMVNTRIQFTLKENVQISQHALEVFDHFGETMQVGDKKPEIFLKKEGNLILIDEKTEASARKAYEMQKELGCNVSWWSPEKVKEIYPIYENLDGIVGATFGPDDGHFDAYALLMGYKSKAISLGAEFVQDEVVELLTEPCKKGSGGKCRQIGGVKTASGERVAASQVVNCTGAWAARLLKSADIDLPVAPTKRQVFAVEPEFKVDYPLPLTFLPSGFYFRTETGGLLLMGFSLEDDPVGFDFSWEKERFEILWEALYNFAPVYESLKLIKGWAGLYAVSLLDANAFLGEWPEIKGLYLANGFSGHGLQQGPAVGRYMMELILKKEPTLDLSIFSPQRILDNAPIDEVGIY